ncbi:autophagy-related protein 18 [[Candida] anglica]
MLKNKGMYDADGAGLSIPVPTDYNNNALSDTSSNHSLYRTHGPPGTEDTVNYITFNQDSSCIAVGLNNGYKIFNCKSSLGRCFHRKEESIGIVEMLYCTSLVAVVGLGDEPGSSPRKLRIINTKRNSTICDLTFPSTILRVKLTRARMIVLLEEQIYIYDISTMKLLHTIETSPNINGLGTLSSEDCDGRGSCFLAYPSPPKTIIHDSLLATGINTNGGSNSISNNIQSVSNTPNRVGDVIIFNVSTLQPLSVIEAHKSTLAAICLSQDGTLLATASDKGTIIRVFSVDSGVKLFQFRRGTYPTRIYSLSFSQDNRYVVATSASETVHIFRLGEDEALVNKHNLKRANKKIKLNTEYSTITEVSEELEQKQQKIKKANKDGNGDESGEVDEEEEEEDDEEEDGEIRDDGDDSDADVDADNGSIEIVPNKQRKLSQGSSNSFASINSNLSIVSSEDQRGEPKTEPIVDSARISMARLIRRSSQTLGRKAAQKMGDFLPSRFSSILEPTRHFASLKIATIGKDVKSIAVLSNELQEDLVPQAYIAAGDGSSNGTPNRENFMENKELLSLQLLHIQVVTSEGYFYTYGLDPERGGDCILLRQYSLLNEGEH